MDNVLQSYAWQYEPTVLHPAAILHLSEILRNISLTLTRPIGLPPHAHCAKNCGSVLTHR